MPVSPPLEEPGLPWQELLEMAFRRWRIIAAVTAVGVGIAGARAVMQPPTYRAAATLIVRTERARVTVSPEARSGVMVEGTNAQLSEQIELLRSPALVREVLSRYPAADDARPAGLAQTVLSLTNPRTLYYALYRKVHDLPEASGLEWQVRSALAGLRVSRLGVSNLISVSYASGSPTWAARFVNDLLQQHIDRSARRSLQAGARDFFERQRALLAKKRDEAQQALEVFYDRVGMRELRLDEAGLRNGLAELQAELADAETDLVEAVAEVDFLVAELAKHPSRIAAESRVRPNNALALLRARLVNLQLEKDELLARYAPGSRTIRELDRQIETVEQRLAAEEETTSETMTVTNPTRQTLELQLVQAQGRQAALEARLSSLTRRVDDHQGQLDRLQEISPEVERLTTEVEAARQAYRLYLEKEEEARFSSALDDSRIVNLNVAEEATVPAAPEPSNALMRAAVAAALSLTLGIALAYARDLMDPTVKSTAQARRLARLPILAEIPR